eukprot:jgi/Bigna1/90547/estExt_fgenesh1_pg.C_730007
MRNMDASLFSPHCCESPFQLGDPFSNWRDSSRMEVEKEEKMSNMDASSMIADLSVKFQARVVKVKSRSRSSSEGSKPTVVFKDIVRTSNNKTIVVLAGDDEEDETAWVKGKHIDAYPRKFQEWFKKFVPTIRHNCRPRQIKKFRRLSKWCRSMVKTGSCSFGVKCNFCHHFTEFSPMRCENDGKCEDPECWYMHSVEVQLRQLYAITNEPSTPPLNGAPMKSEGKSKGTPTKIRNQLMDYRLPDRSFSPTRLRY